MAAINQLLDDIFECIEDKELKLLAKITDPKVPGFSKKRIMEAPAFKLKRAVRDEMNRIRDYKKFFELFILEKRQQYDENDSFEEFWWKLNNDKNITKMLQLVLLYFYHPEKYDEYRRYILNPDEQTRLPEADQDIPFARRLKMHLDLMDMSEVMKWLLIDKADDDEEKTEATLKTWLEGQIKDGFPELGKGRLMNRYFLDQDEWKAWEEPGKESWLHLVIRDAALRMYSMHQEMVALREKVDDMQNRMQSMEKKHVQEQQQWKGIIEKQRKQLEEIMAEMGKTAQKWEEAYQNSKKWETMAEKLEEEKSRLELAQQKLEQELVSLENWLANDGFVLVTEQEHPLLSRMLTSNQLQILDKVSLQELDAWMEQASQDVLYFIDIGNLSTREQFQLEAKLKERGISHRMISGNPLTMIRKIIGYLEGVS